MGQSRLDLPAIEQSLSAVQRDFTRINALLQVHRDPMGDEIVARMLAGYALVDELLRKRIDLFAYGQSGLLLELNTIVLCGRDESRRRAFAPHIAATADRFYDDRGGDFGAIADWYRRHQDESAWLRAAGVYVRALSEPQLFIEGNHRTGALLMSYILARAGKPPFVLRVDNALAYFDPSSVIKHTRKTPMTLLFQLPRIKKRFAKFLEAQADKSFLVRGAEAKPAGKAASPPKATVRQSMVG